jgi:hypothetical protein
LEGDIAARVQVEMRVVRTAQVSLKSGQFQAAPEEHREARLTKEQAAAILAKAGFKIKHINGKSA